MMPRLHSHPNAGFWANFKGFLGHISGMRENYTHPAWRKHMLFGVKSAHRR
jgi:hypothetical protein